MNNTLYEKLISNISESLWNTLKEEYHVLRTFDNVVDDIYNDFINERGRIYGLLDGNLTLILLNVLKKMKIQNLIYSLYM